MSALGLPRSLHSGNAGFIFFGLSNQFVDQAVNAVRQKLDRLKSLDQLEEALRGTVSGKFHDIGQVADTTHRLREEIDQILIGLVESSMVKSERRL